MVSYEKFFNKSQIAVIYDPIAKVPAVTLLVEGPFNKVTKSLALLSSTKSPAAIVGYVHDEKGFVPVKPET